MSCLAETCLSYPRRNNLPVQTKAYATEMPAKGVTDILKLGLAFRDKQVELVRG